MGWQSFILASEAAISGAEVAIRAVYGVCIAMVFFILLRRLVEKSFHLDIGEWLALATVPRSVVMAWLLHVNLYIEISYAVFGACACYFVLYIESIRQHRSVRWPLIFATVFFSLHAILFTCLLPLAVPL